MQKVVILIFSLLIIWLFSPQTLWGSEKDNPVSCQGDLNGDGLINNIDLSELLSAWGPNPGHVADLNEDGDVNIPDLLILLTGWGECPNSQGTIYYFSEDGNDNWSGLLPDPNPQRTDGPKRSASLLTGLANEAQPGTAFLFRRGDTFRLDQKLSFSRASGTQENPILIGAYGQGEKPIFDGQHTSEIIKILPGTSHLLFENLHLTTSRLPGNRPSAGVIANEEFNNPANYPHHITFSHLEIDSLQSGIILYGRDFSVDHSTIRDNIPVPERNPQTGECISECGHSKGIWSDSKVENLTITHNLLERNGEPGNFFHHNLYLNGTNLLVKENISRDATSALKLRRVNNSQIEGNTIHGIDLVGITIGGDQYGGSENNIIQNNLIYDVGDCITIKSQSGPQTEPLANLTVRNNICHSGKEHGLINDYRGFLFIHPDFPAENIKIYNNLFYDPNSESVVNVDNNSNEIELVNNIFVKFDTGTFLEIPNQVIFHHNVLHHPPSNHYGNPRFANPPHDFHLTRESLLAIDQGFPLPGQVDFDFDGIHRPQGNAWDIGPYEFLEPRP